MLSIDRELGLRRAFNRCVSLATTSTGTSTSNRTIIFVHRAFPFEWLDFVRHARTNWIGVDHGPRVFFARMAFESIQRLIIGVIR